MQDFLSIIFDDLHLTDAEYFFVSASNDWAFGVSLPNRLIFHAVLQGEAMVKVGDERYHLSAGDLLIVPTSTVFMTWQAGLTPLSISARHSGGLGKRRSHWAMDRYPHSF